MAHPASRLFDFFIQTGERKSGLRCSPFDRSQTASSRGVDERHLSSCSNVICRWWRRNQPEGPTGPARVMTPMTPWPAYAALVHWADTCTRMRGHEVGVTWLSVATLTMASANQGHWSSLWDSGGRFSGTSLRKWPFEGPGGGTPLRSWPLERWPSPSNGPRG